MKAEEKVIVLLEHLYKEAMADPHDTHLQEKIDNLSAKQITRDLRALAARFDSIVETKEGRRVVFKLVKPVDILAEAFKSDKLGLGMLFEMAKAGMPDIFDEFTDVALRTNKPYLFFHTPFEDIETLENDDNFKSLKNAVERHEYRHIFLKGGKSFKDVKPVKLIFSEGNWYIAYVDGKELRMSRINFIDKVVYATKNGYRPSEIEHYLSWLETKFQNPFSRYDKKRKTATLYARPNIAFYFQEGMKRFFPTQRFLEKTEENGVRFSVDYTQPMEILPFIRRWMPDLIIEAPQELVDAHKESLRKALDVYE
jgi:predicted DNA-binding transcriptional regulator YafY